MTGSSTSGLYLSKPMYVCIHTYIGCIHTYIHRVYTYGTADQNDTRNIRRYKKMKERKKIIFDI